MKEEDFARLLASGLAKHESSLSATIDKTITTKLDKILPAINSKVNKFDSKVVEIEEVVNEVKTKSD